MAKHISRNREWDDVAPLATASYNWLPNQHSKESPFFVTFGRDTLTNLKHLINPKLRYMGTEKLILDLEIMSNIYQAQIHNLKLARQCVIEDQKPVPNPKISTGDLVLVRYDTRKLFVPKYKTDYHVIRVLGNKVEVKDNNGKMSWFYISDVKKTDMITKLICQLPDYDAFGHKGRLNFDPVRVKDLGWSPDDEDVIFDPSYISDVPDKETAAAVKAEITPHATEKYNTRDLPQ